MRLLCEYEFTGQELGYILQQLPSEFAKYYYTLGPEKIKAVSCRKCLLEEAYSKLMFDTTSMTNDIYSSFSEGDRLSTQDVVNRLIPIYEKYNNPNRPKGVDIKDYFQTSETKITLSDKSLARGFKLIKKLY